MENLTQPSEPFFFIPRVSQPEPMVREWQCPTCFQGLLTAVSGISGRNTWTTRKMDFKRFEERKGNISYRYHILIYIRIFVWTYINTIIQLYYIDIYLNMMLNVFFCSLFNMLNRLQLHGAFAAGRSEELGETSKCEGRSNQVAVVLAGWTFGKLMNILTIVLF